MFLLFIFNQYFFSWVYQNRKIKDPGIFDVEDGHVHMNAGTGIVVHVVPRALFGGNFLGKSRRHD